MDEERQRFEAWAKPLNVNLEVLKHSGYPPGTYADSRTDAAFKGWLAAKADAKAQAEAATKPDIGMQWPDWLQYDRPADVLTVHGLKYSGHVFESMAIAEPGTWLRITERRDGILTVRTVDEQKEQLFTALADLPEGMVKAVIDPRPPLEQQKK